jgi:uncharacterized protein YeaO (DUF488 family)
MSLMTQCILAPREATDGLRISIMSRHTLNDGITPNPSIKETSYEQHFPELAPSLILLGDYYKRHLSWAAFERRFRAQMHTQEMRTALQTLALQALMEDITLLCIEDTPEHCHRRLVAEECKLLVPELTIVIR